jgi:hypothetical protein
MSIAVEKDEMMEHSSHGGLYQYTILRNMRVRHELKRTAKYNEDSRDKHSTTHTVIDYDKILAQIQMMEDDINLNDHTTKEVSKNSGRVKITEGSSEIIESSSKGHLYQYSHLKNIR